MSWHWKTKRVKVEDYRCKKCKESDRTHNCYTGICNHKIKKREGIE